MNLLREYPEKIYLGLDKENQEVYMEAPKWSCDWYWSFGYIHSKDYFTHLNCLGGGNLYSNIIKFFNEFVIKYNYDLWQFCELVQTIYTLKRTAELLHRGGSHYAPNPCQELLKNSEFTNHINEVLIPELVDKMYGVLGV